VRLLFPTPQLRRLVEGTGTVPGIDADALGHFFEVIAVVGAARSIDDLTALRAFAPARLDAPSNHRWGIPMGPEWQLVVRIDDGPPRTASLEEIRSRPQPRRTR
jgi:plasmid maintenance system killer protein